MCLFFACHVQYGLCNINPYFDLSCPTKLSPTNFALPRKITKQSFILIRQKINLISVSRRNNPNYQGLVNTNLSELNNENYDAAAIVTTVPKKRGKPPKIATQQTASEGITDTPFIVASTQPAIARREDFRSHRKKRYQIY